MTSPVAPSTAAASAKPDRAAITKVAKQFEAVFMRQMISSMRSASLADDLFDSSAEDQFRDMSDAKLADGMAGTNGGFGIAKLLIKQLGGDAAEPQAPKP